MITGLTNYLDKKCVFKLENFEVKIDEIDNRDKVYLDDLDFLFNNEGNSIESPDVLEGKDFENERDFYFNVRNVYKTGAKTHIASLSSYVVMEKYHKESILFDGLQFNSEELNWFHNIKQAYSFTVVNDGQSEITINPFKDTQKCFKFNFENQEIQVIINISRSLSSVSTLPIRLKTDMNFHFEPTGDFNFIERLINVAYDFLKFITYRRSVTFNDIYLKKEINNSGIYQKTGKIYLENIKSNYTEEDKVIRNRLITLPVLENQLGNLLEKLAENKIYIKHIPLNSEDKRTITPARIIMSTAGFEWQFHFTYNDQNTENDEKYEDQKEEIINFFEEKIKQNTGKKKKYFKSYKKLFLKSDMTLSNKLNWALNEFKDVLDIFITPLYKLHNITDVKYNDIAERLQTERNNVAHGNIDKDFDSLVILDLLVLEWLYYAMVLHNVGISREKIKVAINDLFNRRVLL